jgi:hypothetical protein
MVSMTMRIGFRRVPMAAAGIGAALGIERRFDLDHASPQSLHHRLDDMIAPDAQAPGRDLRRQMTVTEMPGKPHQMLGIAASDLGQRLRRGDDLDQPVIVKHQRVTTSQHGCGFQIEQKFKAARSPHRHPPPVTIVEIENDGIGRRFGPAMLCPDLRGADHVKMPGA